MLSNVALGYAISNTYAQRVSKNNQKSVAFGAIEPPVYARRQSPEAVNKRQLLRNVEAFFAKTYSSACAIAAEEKGLTNPHIEDAGKKILRTYTRPTGQEIYIKWNVDKKDIIPSFEKMLQAVNKMIETSTAEIEKLGEKASEIKNALNAKKLVSIEEEQILRQYNFHCGQKDYAKLAKNILTSAINFCKIV